MTLWAEILGERWRISRLQPGRVRLVGRVLLEPQWGVVGVQVGESEQVTRVRLLRTDSDGWTPVEAVDREVSSG